MISPRDSVFVVIHTFIYNLLDKQILLLMLSMCAFKICIYKVPVFMCNLYNHSTYI